MHLNRTIVIAALAILALLVVGFGAYQFQVLRRAHGSLANYAAFRGCASLRDETATSAACVLPSGKTITLVEIGSRWYLEGDGPGVW